VQNGYTPLFIACANDHKEVVKLLLAHPGVDINKTTKVRGRGGVGRERVQGGQRSWVHTRGCGGGRLTSHSLTMLSWMHCWVGMCRVDARRCTWPVTRAAWRW
jgi:ankyrin repeat protein